jgi:hypothetical protein
VRHVRIGQLLQEGGQGAVLFGPEHKVPVVGRQ